VSATVASTIPDGNHITLLQSGNPIQPIIYLQYNYLSYKIQIIQTILTEQFN